MIVTAEISLNPLSDSYASVVTQFCEGLLANAAIEVRVSGLSTLLIGEYSQVMSAIEEQLIPVFDAHKAVFHLKMAPGHHTVEGLPDSLR